MQMCFESRLSTPIIKKTTFLYVDYGIVKNIDFTL